MKTYKQLMKYLKEVEDTALLRRFARKQGVRLNISGEDEWKVHSIRRNGSQHTTTWGGDDSELKPGEKKGKPGAGATVMKAIAKQADKKQKTVRLQPDNDHLANHFYGRLGYEDDKSDPRRMPDMIRKPRPK
jgi:hypothetical protein